MAGGTNHAKQIVIDQADALANDLQNGHAGDLDKIGRLLSLHTRMIASMYENDFMTVADCVKNREKEKLAKITKFKIGPISIEGRLSTALVSAATPILCCAMILFGVGKAEGWW